MINICTMNFCTYYSTQPDVQKSIRKPTCTWEGRQHSIAVYAEIMRSFG